MAIVYNFPREPAEWLNQDYDLSLADKERLKAMVDNPYCQPVLARLVRYESDWKDQPLPAPRWEPGPHIPFDCGTHDCLVDFLYSLPSHARGRILYARRTWGVRAEEGFELLAGVARFAESIKEEKPFMVFMTERKERAAVDVVHVKIRPAPLIKALMGRALEMAKADREVMAAIATMASKPEAPTANCGENEAPAGGAGRDAGPHAIDPQAVAAGKAAQAGPAMAAATKCRGGRPKGKAKAITNADFAEECGVVVRTVECWNSRLREARERAKAQGKSDAQIAHVRIPIKRSGVTFWYYGLDQSASDKTRSPETFARAYNPKRFAER